jgi:hypothetical protein
MQNECAEKISKTANIYTNKHLVHNIDNCDK